MKKKKEEMQRGKGSSISRHIKDIMQYLKGKRKGKKKKSKSKKKKKNLYTFAII